MPPPRKPPKPAERDGLARELLFSQLSADTAFYQIFNHLPDVAFFAKDAQCRIIGASRLFYERFGFQKEEEILGMDDFELFPRTLAETFRRDDEAVLSTGQARLNLVELFFNRQGLPDWYITNKLPLRNRDGAVVGLMGTTHSYENRKALLRPFLHLDRAIEYIRAHFREKISIERLAQQLHLSPRQLHRKFVETFGVGPQAFILKLRIQTACDALQDENQLIADVATAVGFCDQSAMTQAFHRLLGITPRQYQLQFRLRRH
jgi:AraC-like DNA-binding protein